jgi:hypothetical protein
MAGLRPPCRGRWRRRVNDWGGWYDTRDACTPQETAPVKIITSSAGLFDLDQFCERLVALHASQAAEVRDMDKARNEGDEFATLVRQILVIEKRHSLRDVAAALGMEYANFHARVCGRVHFKAEEINRLIREVPDVRLCDFLLRHTRYLPVERPHAGEFSHEGALHAATRVAGECLAVIEQITASVVHGRLEPAAYEVLVTHVHEAERAVATLLAALPGLAPRKFRSG